MGFILLVFNQIASALPITSGRYVAVGASGVIIVSLDGNNWINVPNPDTDSDNRIEGIVWGGEFVAVDTAANILTSKDGFNWSSQALATYFPLDTVATNQQGQYVAGSSNGEIFMSNDPEKSWTRVYIAPLKIANSISHIIWNGQAYVAVGAHGFVAMSSDGTNWTQMPIPSTNYEFSGIDFDPVAKIYIAVAYEDLSGSDSNTVLLRSDDGAQTWTKEFSNDTADVALSYTVLWDGKEFLEQQEQNSTLFVSQDGKNWQAEKLPVYGSGSSMIVHGQTLLAVGMDGAGYGTIWSAPLSNITQWTPLFRNINKNLYAIAWGNVNQTEKRG